ncbi:MAG: energy transducer TonB [Flavobacteriaceae bacterium]|nr:energy transducer TonB [Flavobacteriaceae bacterium]
MKYFDTKHEKDAARLTGLIAILLILLIFVVGPKYMDPPEEYGVAVNFGTSNVGSGQHQPKEPVRSEPLNSPNDPNTPKDIEQKEAAQPIESSASPQDTSEDIMTQDDLEAMAVQKAEKEAAKKKVAEQAKRKAEAEAAAKAEAEAKARAEAERKAKEAKRNSVDNLIGGIGKSDDKATGGEGPDSQPGDKGQLNGDPYAPSYFGQPGSGNGGVGYGLNGRGKPTRSKVLPDCNEEGRVVVEIHVNRKGEVVAAIPGKKGTTGDICLYAAAKKTAKSHKWPADAKAPMKQIGYVKVDFTVRQ